MSRTTRSRTIVNDSFEVKNSGYSMHRLSIIVSQKPRIGVQLNIPTRVYGFGQRLTNQGEKKPVLLTAAIIHPMLSAATICNGRLAFVTRKIRQYSARSDNLLKVRARG